MVQTQHQSSPPSLSGSSSQSSSSNQASSTCFNKYMNPYSLTGLLSLIRVSDTVSSTLALGIDLSTLGLDLSATEYLFISFIYRPLYMNFVSPWGNPSARLHQLLPPCYNLNIPPLSQQPGTNRLGSLSEEALFYLFYHHCTVGSEQPFSSKIFPICVDLCRRGWRWHKDVGIWVQPPSAASIAAAASKDNLQTASRTLFIAFDPIKWEKKQFDHSLHEGIPPTTSTLIDFSVVKSL